MEGLELFPANGLDKSILTPVLVGVALLTLAAETLGWSYTGLVVPGYLAAIFSTAPITGATVCVESVIAYGIARGIGLKLPQVEAWSTFFGRERFFLVIAASMLVRLFSEGVALPTLAKYYNFAHASELYSIGLVLIPLVANSAWNIGLTRGVLQNAIVGFLTWVILQTVLLPYTNLTLARVELSYESVALDFMAAPKAYVVLLAGTLLGARANVRYGWDFHGILVPGLLAVAWYSPNKLGATFFEAIMVAMTARTVVKLPGFRRRVIEGPRRTFLAFCIGFSFKWILGGTMVQFFPGERATDLYGFGYVLPTLLALKIWQYGSVPRVLMPTIQTSLLGFIFGNLAGYTLATAWPAPEPAAATEARVLHAKSLPLQLTVQAALPVNTRPRAIQEETLDALVGFAKAASRGRVGLAVDSCAEQGLELISVIDPELGTVWLARDNRAARYTPALAVRSEGRGGMVVRGEEPLQMVTASLATAAALDLKWWFLWPNGVRADKSFAKELAKRLPLGGVRTLTVTSGGTRLAPLIRGDGARLSRNALPWHLQARSATLDRRGLEELDVWVWGSEELADPLPWSELEAIFSADSYRLDPKGRLRRAEMRAFTRYVVEPVQRWAEGEEMSPAEYGMVHGMGFSVHRLSGIDGEGLALHRRNPTHPGEALLWATRRVPASMAVAAPTNRPRGSIGSFARTVAITSDARHLLLGNIKGRHSRAPADTMTVRRSYYQRVLEALLAADQPVLSVRAAPHEDLGSPADAVLTKARGISDGAPPGYVAPVLDVLARAGLTHTWYTGGRETYRYRGSGDPLLDYARRLYSREVVGVWLSERARERFSLRVPSKMANWLARLQLNAAPAELAVVLASPPADTSECDLDATLTDFDHLRDSGNPALLNKLYEAQVACPMQALRDVGTGRSFLVIHGASESVALGLAHAESRIAYEVTSPEEARNLAAVGATEIHLRRRVP